MNDSLSQALDREARSLREIIYGTINDIEWANVRDFWIKDLDWLRRTARDSKL